MRLFSCARRSVCVVEEPRVTLAENECSAFQSGASTSRVEQLSGVNARPDRHGNAVPIPVTRDDDESQLELRALCKLCRDGSCWMDVLDCVWRKVRLVGRVIGENQNVAI